MNKLKLYRNLIRCSTVAFVLIVFQSSSQTLQRQCIASGGTYMLNEGTLIQQTVGQPYATNAYYSKEIGFRPGFQQPVSKMKVMHSAISLNVFPNPATTLVTVQSSVMLKDAIIQVNDMAGKIVIRQQIIEFTSYSFNCENLANGFYTISVADGGKNVCSSKLIILK